MANGKANGETMATSSASDCDKIENTSTRLNDPDGHEIESNTSYTTPLTLSTTPSIKNMGLKSESDHRKKSASSIYKKEKTREFLQHMTTTSHACTLLFVILIVYFCFSAEFQLFTWHPLLLSTGWMFLMSEAILAVSTDNLFTGTLPKTIRIRLHWILQSLASVFITAGFFVVFVNKNNLGKDHFTTWHGLFGLIGVVATIPTCLDGVAALYNVNLRHYVKPKLSKFVHVTSGIATYTFGGVALVLSVYTKWFEKHSNDNIITFVLGLMLAVIAVVWTLLKPTIACFSRLKLLMS